MFAVRYRITQLDTHAHIDVFIDHTEVEVMHKRGPRVGHLIVRAQELAEFAAAISAGAFVTWEYPGAPNFAAQLQ